MEFVCGFCLQFIFPFYDYSVFLETFFLIEDSNNVYSETFKVEVDLHHH